MKSILGLLMTFALFSSLKAQAATADISPSCKSQLENVLAKKSKFPVEVLHVEEVGMGSLNVEHFILFSEKNVGGRLFRALGVADSGDCPVAIESVKTVYSVVDSETRPHSCMTKAIERSLEKARKQYPDFLAMVPVQARFVGVEEVQGVALNKYAVHVQITTSDDYSEDMTFEYRFPNKSCIQ